MQVHLAVPPADPYLLPASASCPVEADAKLMTLSGTVGSDPRPNSSFPESLDCTPPSPRGTVLARGLESNRLATP